MARILVIDDDDDLRAMVQRALARRGHVISEARNGKEAVNILTSDPPNLVICDLIMPDQDGVETILWLRRKYPALRILAISGLEPAHLRMAEKLGAAATLAKPFSIHDLEASVERLLQQ
jgi:DNA-binding response OmpR family regulator